VTERQTQICITESIIGRENPHCSIKFHAPKSIS